MVKIRHLTEDPEVLGGEVVGGLVEAGIDVESADLLDLVLGEVESDGLQVGDHVLLTGGLGDDGKATLGGPAKEDLGGGLAVLGGDGLDSINLHQRLDLAGMLHVELLERGGAEGGVGSDGDTLVFGKTEKLVLDEVGVVLDLEGGRLDAGIAEQVIDELGLEVGDTDALGETGVNQLLHGGPGLLGGSLGGADLGLAVVVPAGGVADAGVDVLKGDGEVNQVEVEVVETPVGELLLDDGLNTVAIVESVPQLGDDEEVLTLDEAILDRTGNTLTALLLVAVV